MTDGDDLDEDTGPSTRRRRRDDEARRGTAPREEPDDDTVIGRRRSAAASGEDGARGAGEPPDEDTMIGTRRARAGEDDRGTLGPEASPDVPDDDTVIGARRRLADVEDETHIAIRRRVGRRPTPVRTEEPADGDTRTSGRRIGAELGDDTIRSRRRVAASGSAEAIPTFSGRRSTDGHAEHRIYRTRTAEHGPVHAERAPLVPPRAGEVVDTARAGHVARRASRRILVSVVVLMAVVVAVAVAAVVVIASLTP